MKRIVIVTGVSRGLGLSLAKILISNNETVIGISRSECRLENRKFKHYLLDLTKSKQIEEFAMQLKNTYGKATSIVLFNNAGIVEPIGNLEFLEIETIVQSLTVNFVAPVILVKKLMENTEDLKIVNISSGAATNPIENWECYCSSKAGVKMFIDVLSKNNKVEGINIDPGAIDTDIQTKIRSYSREKLPNVQDFINYKENGILKSADSAALEIYGETKKKNYLP